MEAAPAESNARVIVRTDGGGARTSKGEGYFVAGPRAVRAGDITEETYAKEDWLPSASADPAFWIKGVDS